MDKEGRREELELKFVTRRDSAEAWILREDLPDTFPRHLRHLFYLASGRSSLAPGSVIAKFKRGPRAAAALNRRDFTQLRPRRNLLKGTRLDKRCLSYRDRAPPPTI